MEGRITGDSPLTCLHYSSRGLQPVERYEPSDLWERRESLEQEKTGK
jgi:hypothetical protein